MYYVRIREGRGGGPFNGCKAGAPVRTYSLVYYILQSILKYVYKHVHYIYDPERQLWCSVV